MNSLLSGRILRFEKFRLDTTKQVLWRDDAIVELTPKSVAVLCELVDREGAVVTKEELIENIWPDSFVEESNLSNQIYTLRKMFRDFGLNENLIETVQRKGYRFTGKVTAVSESADDLGDSKQFVVIEPIVSAPPAVNDSEKRPRWPLIAVAAVLIIVISGFAAWRISLPGDRTIRSLAVLPIRSFEKSDNNLELHLRMTDSLITRLGRLKDVAVRPTSAVIKFATVDGDPLEIGRKLAVDAVIDGRIQTESGRIRVTLQLLSVATGERIWSEQFDGDENRLLDLQDSISAKLISHLNLSLSNEQRSTFAKRPTVNSDAFEEYLKGRSAWQKRTEDGLRDAIASFEKAVRLDPQFAEALVGLADSYFLLVDYSYDTSPSNVVRAQEFLTRALEIEPNLPDAYTTLGYIQTAYLWNWEAAEKSLLQAIELAPNGATAHHRHGMLLVRLRRFAEAETALRRARDLDPTSPSVNMNLGVVLFFAKRYPQALEQFDATLAAEPNFTAPRWYRARCLWMLNRRDESIGEYGRALRGSGSDDLAGKFEAMAADPTAAINFLLTQWKSQTGPDTADDHSIAILAALVQDRDVALSYLKKSVESRHPWSSSINAEPEFDFIHTEPRFLEILKAMKLTPRTTLP